MRTLTNEEMSEVAGGCFFRRSRCGGGSRTRHHYRSRGGCGESSYEPECQPEPPQCEPEPPQCQPEPSCGGNTPVEVDPIDPPVVLD